MRTLRRSLAVTATLSLLASLPGASLAQEEEPAPVTVVTGTVVEQFDHIEQEGWDERQEGGPRYVRGYEVVSGRGIVIEQDVDWSDPRLPRKHWVSLAYTIVYEPPEGGEGAMVVSTSHLLEGADGSWRGTGRAVEDADDRFSQYALVGEGAYEGLYALIRGTPGMDTHGPWDHSYDGYIFEGELPLFPDPVEPVTTGGMQTFPFPAEPPVE
jgi:hypothetical protein